jgi:hypothetical protein
VSDDLEAPEPVVVLAEMALRLESLGQRFALVGGLAVSARAEPRFTRDVDIAVDLPTDAAVESLVRDLTVGAYRVAAVVEHEARERIATVRLRSRGGVVVDLLAASSGIEHEIVERAVAMPATFGSVLVSRAEELLAMKVLSMTERRLQDRIDAVNLVLESPSLSLDEVRANLCLIQERGYDREQDLEAKLAAVLEAARGA